MSKDPQGNLESTLFLEGNDHHSLLWSGPKCNAQLAIQHFGVDRAEDFKRVEEFLASHKPTAALFYDDNPNSCLSKNLLGSHKKVNSIDTILDKQRVVKSLDEQGVMQIAGKVAGESFAKVMRFSKSTRKESDLAAKMEFECRIRGASGLAYVPVVAGDDRANIIHYVRNDRIISDDGMVLMDAGAKMYGYCSDITRTWPVSGRFTDPQRELYSAVLSVQKKCITAASKWHQLPEMNINTLHQLSAYFLREELYELGFKNLDRTLDKLYPHSIGHFLGLDLHDCQTLSYEVPFRKGMVITIEPGLYVPFGNDFPQRYQGIGIRIEDDILLTEGGCQVLTTSAPKEIEEIEMVMNS